MKGLNETVLSSFLMACNKAISDLNKAKEDNRMYKSIMKPIISSSTKMTIENLMYTIRMITSKEYKNDYRACVIENTVKDFKHVRESRINNKKIKYYLFSIITKIFKEYIKFYLTF